MQSSEFSGINPWLGPAVVFMHAHLHQHVDPVLMMEMRRTQIDEHQNTSLHFPPNSNIWWDDQSHRPKYSATLNWSTFQEGNLCFKKGDTHKNG